MPFPFYWLSRPRLEGKRTFVVVVSLLFIYLCRCLCKFQALWNLPCLYELLPCNISGIICSATRCFLFLVVPGTFKTAVSTSISNATAAAFSNAALTAFNAAFSTAFAFRFACSRSGTPSRRPSGIGGENGESNGGGGEDGASKGGDVTREARKRKRGAW